MTDPPPTFEGMMTSCGPVLESVMENLTRWDFRNLQLAGVGISVGREYHRRHHLPNRCNEIIPENSGQECENTTGSFDIRPCAGRPSKVMKNGELFLEERVGATPLERCLRDEEWRWYLLEPNPLPEPNTDQYPIHTKICRPCHDASAAELLQEQSLTIAQFNTPLCKLHSLDDATAQFPLNACRCLDFVRKSWRCRRCYQDTLMYLHTRADFPPPFRRIIPGWQRPWVYLTSLDWQRPWVYLNSLWTPQQHGPVCPVEGCSRQAWLDQTGERMQMCLSCYAITKI